MKDSAHYYRSDGTSCHELPNKSKPGTFRATTLRDARALGLLPSVTTILSVLARPQLDDWKHRQITEWCRLNPYGSENAEVWHAQAMEGAFAKVSDAADLGTDIHKALEQHFQGQAFAPALAPYVEAVDKWAKAEGITFEQHELRLASKSLGFAGTTDAVISCERGRGILDFKSRKTVAGKPATPYDTQPMQIAAYWVACFGHFSGSAEIGCNLFISTTEPGRVDACWYDAEQLQREWLAFEQARNLFFHLKSYDPRTP